MTEAVSRDGWLPLVACRVTEPFLGRESRRGVRRRTGQQPSSHDKRKLESTRSAKAQHVLRGVRRSAGMRDRHTFGFASNYTSVARVHTPEKRTRTGCGTKVEAFAYT